MAEDEHGNANVAFVREWADGFNRGEAGSLAERADPEIQWVVAREHPAATTHVGIEAIERYLGDWRQTLPGMRMKLDRIEAFRDKVLAVGEISGTGAESGIGIGVQIAFVSTYEGERVVRVEEYLDPAEAERAAKRAG
jgi:ketosteroid isomerase-like protein